MKHLTFRESIYKFDVHLVQGTLNEVDDWIADTFGPDCVPDAEGIVSISARTQLIFGRTSAHVILWFPPKFNVRDSESVGTIGHEAFHGASFMLNASDMPLTSGSEEAYAYLVGMLTKRCYEFLSAAPSRKRNVKSRKVKKGARK